MRETVQGMAWILGVGVLLLVVAAVLDWRSRRRAEREVDAQIAQALPAGQELPRPDYVSEAEAHRPASARRLSAEEAAEIDSAMKTEQVVRFDAGWIDPKVANDDDRVALTHVSVLACDQIGSLREVLQPLDRAAKAGTALLIATTAVDPEVADVLVVNVARGTLTATAVVLGPDDLAALTELSGATLVTQTDLQAGYLPHSVMGLVAHLVQDAEQTVVAPVAASDGDAALEPDPEA